MMPLTNTCEENDDPTLEECYEYDEAEYYQNNNTEEQVGSESNHNPQRRKRKRKSRKKPAHGSKVVLELQLSQLITQLDTNLIPKNKPFTSWLILLTQKKL